MITFKKSKELDMVFDYIKNQILDNINYMNLVSEWKDEIVSDEMAEVLMGKINTIYPNTVAGLVVDSDRYTKNDYNKNIKLNVIEGNNVNVKIVEVGSRVIDHVGFGETRFLLDGYIPIGYYDKDIKVPVLVDSDGEVWMSPTVSEIDSIQPHVDRARGNVCTVGLGLGYYVYMCANKEEVESITVVERNKEIIDIFNTYILPQFNERARDKVKVIEGDLFEWYSNGELDRFDYTFIDTWKNNDDGLTDYYIPMMEIGLPKDNIGFWIENRILDVPTMLLAVYCMDRYNGNKSVSEFMNGVGDLNRGIAIKVNRYCKKLSKEFSSSKELLDFLSDKQVIREMLAYKR